VPLTRGAAFYLWVHIAVKRNHPRFVNPQDRQRILSERRNLKMARSAHAYVRGNTGKLYEWLAADGRVHPQGPSVWICGDCHLGNLGPIADADPTTPPAVGDPQHAAAAPKPRLRRADRSILVPAMPLDDLLTPEHHARTVWQFVQGLDLSPLLDTIRAVEGGPGRPAIDPQILAALMRLPARQRQVVRQEEDGVLTLERQKPARLVSERKGNLRRRRQVVQQRLGPRQRGRWQEGEETDRLGGQARRA